MKKIICDKEGAFVKLTADLERLGIIVESGAGSSHPSGKIDRRIRSIKESVRCTLLSLPYNLPLSLLKYAVMFSVSRFNLFRHSHGWADGTSPRELVTGRKTDYRRDCRAKFGEFCIVDVPYTDNGMQQRGTSCLALFPDGSASGAFKFYSLKTGKIITADKWRSLPYPPEIVDFVNN